MHDLKEIKRTLSDYNEEPVVYCKNCLSLNIRVLDSNTNYCDCCGNVETEEIDIYSWEKLYEDKYGVKFLNS